MGRELKAESRKRELCGGLGEEGKLRIGNCKLEISEAGNTGGGFGGAGGSGSGPHPAPLPSDGRGESQDGRRDPGRRSLLALAWARLRFAAARRQARLRFAAARQAGMSLPLWGAGGQGSSLDRHETRALRKSRGFAGGPASGGNGKWQMADCRVQRRWKRAGIVCRALSARTCGSSGRGRKNGLQARPHPGPLPQPRKLSGPGEGIERLKAEG